MLREKGLARAVATREHSDPAWEKVEVDRAKRPKSIGKTMSEPYRA
jgi:hypothetical protein